MMIRRTLVAFLVVLAVFVGFGIAQAVIVNGPVVLTCTGIDGFWAIGTAERDNTGTGREAYRFIVTDGAGTVLFDFSSSVPVGTTLPIGSAPYTTAPAYNPITLMLYSLAGNGLPEIVTFTTQGNCAGLPTAATVGCALPVPDGSVVGEAPLGALAYYEPGNATNIVVNPGTYIVVGQDESETYYKIVLACEFLWVRKDTMQPSFLPPQNGAPLPTRIVE